MPLTDRAIKNAELKEKRYRLTDERGMYLEIHPNGSKYWRLKYRFAGKEKLLALGVYPTISLKEARQKRDDAKKLLSDGIDPSQKKKQDKLESHSSAENTFEAIANEWFYTHMKTKSDSHQAKTRGRLEQKLFPYIGKRPITDITAPELLEVLRKEERKGHIETAHRLESICPQIFRFGIATGKAERDTAADLTGALTPIKKQHLAAFTEPKDVTRLMRAIYSYDGSIVVTSALKLSALFFSRPSELRTLKWEWVNWDKEIIELPEGKTKTDVPLIIPLAPQAIEIIKELEPISGDSDYLFPSPRGNSRPLSENSPRTALRAMGFTNEEMTPHGFRAMARTLLDEELEVPIHYIEQQLAHTVKDANGRAYNRTKHLVQRKDMMCQWANYLDQLRLNNN